MSFAAQWIAAALAQDAYPDDMIRAVLESVRTIALVGASANPDRPSHQVLAFLISAGYELFPINPGLAGKELCGRRVYGKLADVPAAIDLVDIFRQSDAVPQVVDDALGLNPRPKAIWMQLGVRNDAAAEKARKQGVTVIQNRCPKIEFVRLNLSRRS